MEYQNGERPDFAFKAPLKVVSEKLHDLIHQNFLYYFIWNLKHLGNLPESFGIFFFACDLFHFTTGKVKKNSKSSWIARKRLSCLIPVNCLRLLSTSLCIINETKLPGQFRSFENVLEVFCTASNIHCIRCIRHINGIHSIHWTWVDCFSNPKDFRSKFFYEG